MSENVDFGGGKSRTMEYVLIVALGVIIVGCLVVAAYQIFGHSGSGGGNAATEVRFKCTKEDCGYEFTMTEVELRKAQQDNRAGFDPMRGNFRVPCPKCHQLGARQMMQCPICHGWFLGPEPAMPGPRGPMANPAQPGPQASSSECPLCHGDIVKWYNDEYEKQHGHH
jgi:hypothetical protein